MLTASGDAYIYTFSTQGKTFRESSYKFGGDLNPHPMKNSQSSKDAPKAKEEVKVVAEATEGEPQIVMGSKGEREEEKAENIEFLAT